MIEPGDPHGKARGRRHGPRRHGPRDQAPTVVWSHGNGERRAIHRAAIVSGPMAEIEDALLTQIAKLARLSLDPAETTSLAHDLKEILKYADSLSSINLDGVPAMSHAIEGERFRSDEPHHHLTREQALQNAPDQESGLFRVPQVIGG